MLARNMEMVREASTLSATESLEGATKYLESGVHAPSRGHSAKLPSLSDAAVGAPAHRARVARDVLARLALELLRARHML